MKSIVPKQRSLTVSILSLSLLTVMAEAAVAPALGVIKEHFAGSNQLFVQMIISMPALFTVGYLLLSFAGGWAGVLIGSACVGFANGCGVPCIISSASKAAGRCAATSVMPLISAALYLAQFLNPFLMSLTKSIAASGAVRLPYYAGIAVSAVLLLWSGTEQER